MAHRPIMIFASEVPVIAALNRFRGIDEVFETVWKRTEPDLHSRAMSSLAAQGITVEEKEEKVERILKESELAQPIRAIHERAQLSDTVEQIAANVREVQELIEKSGATTEAKDLLQDHAKSKINMEFGARKEDSSIASYEKQTRKIVKDKNNKFYKRAVGTTGHSFRKVLVGGRIDGAVDDKVIEVKNRINRLPDPIPDYDIAQLNVYLFLLEKQRGEMVETLRTDQGGSDNGQPTQRVTSFDFDNELWSNLLVPRLLQFSHAIDLFLVDDPRIHMQFIGTEDQQERQELIKPYWLQAVAELRAEQHTQ
jgi:hypothetical protein